MYVRNHRGHPVSDEPARTWRIGAGMQCAALLHSEGRLRVRQIASGPEAAVKVCGVVAARLSGYQVDTSLADRHVVNVGCAGINRQEERDENAQHRRSSDPRWP